MASTDTNVSQETDLVSCLGERPTWFPDDTLTLIAQNIESFRGPTSFTRWVFSDPCGAGLSQVPLVTGWREATPCMNAVAALRSGDDTRLRIDKGRPALPGAVVVPICALVVVVDEKKKQAALKWAKDSKFGLSIMVASNMPEFMAAMHAVMSTVRAAPASMPGCRMAAPPGLGPRAGPHNPMADAPPPGLQHPGEPSMMRPPPGLDHPRAPRAPKNTAAAFPNLGGYPDARRQAQARSALQQKECLALERERLQMALMLAHQQRQLELMSQHLANMSLSNPEANLWAPIDPARAMIPNEFQTEELASQGCYYF